MGRLVSAVLVWRFMAVVVHAVACCALYLTFSTLLEIGYDTAASLTSLGLLVAAIAFNYSLNLWSLSVLRYRVSMAIGLFAICLSICLYRDTALSITLAVSGALPTLSASVAILTAYPRVTSIGKHLAKVFLVPALLASAIALAFVFYRPTLPVFIGRDVVLPTGSVAKAEDVLKAYVEKGERGILVTDYGNIAVNSVKQFGEEVALDTQRGVVNIAYKFFEMLKRVGEAIMRSGIEIDVKDAEVSTLEMFLARLYPYVKPLADFISRTSINILKLV